MSGKLSEAVIILGGTGALGGVVVPVLAQAGYHVVVYSRKEVAGERYELQNVSVHVGSLDDAGCVGDMLELALFKAERLRGAVFINGAFNWDEGVGAPEFTQRLQELFEANVFPITKTLEKLGPYWAEHGNGRVVVTSATAAHKPFPKAGAYAIAKHAVEDIGRQIELEFEPEQLQAHVLAPRMIGTRVGQNAPAELAQEILTFLRADTE